MEKDRILIDAKKGNVTSKYYVDNVMLVGKRIMEDSPYMENLQIIIENENKDKIITDVPYGGYNLELFLGDFNGDSKDEIMVRGDYGGSGGFAIVFIYEFVDGELKEIFSPDRFYNENKATAKYIEGYKVLIQSEKENEYYEFDISKKPKIYLDMIYDENGKVLEFATPSISGVNSAFPIKILYLDRYWLFIRQRIVGVANSDTIGYIESFVDFLNNKINIMEVGYYNFGYMIDN